jgi:SAM-dependent methyltransferase
MTGRLRATYDTIAAAYDAGLRDELDHKPLDRALLTALAELTGDGTLADVGCGPGHVTRFLKAHGSTVLGVDLSPAMVSIARAHDPGIAYVAGSMLDLPVRDGAWAGAVALYSIIHLDARERAAAFREFARVLRPGAPLLVAFHLSDGGDSVHLTTWFGAEVDVDVHFLDPAAVRDDLTAAGFTIAADLVREPLDPAEYPSRRAYLLALREPVLRSA